ncbi:hypothetical protein D3C78_1262070 [compost metagenome]
MAIAGCQINKTAFCQQVDAASILELIFFDITSYRTYAVRQRFKLYLIRFHIEMARVGY